MTYKQRKPAGFEEHDRQPARENVERYFGPEPSGQLVSEYAEAIVRQRITGMWEPDKIPVYAKRIVENEALLHKTVRCAQHSLAGRANETSCPLCVREFQQIRIKERVTRHCSDAMASAREREALAKVHDIDQAFGQGMLAELKMQLSEL